MRAGQEMTPGRPMSFGELAARIRALAPRPADLSGSAAPPALSAGKMTRPSTLAVGIDGMSGAGKTSFAQRLAAELSAPLLSVDDLVPGWDGLEESVSMLADSVLTPLAAGLPARWRRWDWHANAPGEWTEIDPGDFLVVEGCCVGLEPAAGLLSYLVWIDTPQEERWRRLELRADWATYAPFFRRWAEQESKLQAPAQTPIRADLVVDNSEESAADDWSGHFIVGSGG